MSQRLDEFFELAYLHGLQMLDTGKPNREILGYLTLVAEIAGGEGAVSSILVLDEKGLLRNGASPKLPADYLKAIDGLKPNPRLGTCAAVAATGLIVYTPDFSADDKWAELRHLPQSLGFVGAWSHPIKNSEGKVLGTFGTYFREYRTPSESEVKGVSKLSDIVALVLSR